MGNKSPKQLTKLMCLRVDAETKAMMKRAKGLGINGPKDLRPIIKEYYKKKLKKYDDLETLIPGEAQDIKASAS
jgi:hypothetical protein